jgi:hypothetical protein
MLGTRLGEKDIVREGYGLGGRLKSKIAAKEAERAFDENENNELKKMK